MEDIVFSEGNDESTFQTPITAAAAVASPHSTAQNLEKVESFQLDEKSGATQPSRTHFSLPRPARISQWSRRLRRFTRAAVALVTRSQDSHPKAFSTSMTLRGLARTRRLVTSLTRLLATKSEVVAQIRKRLLTLRTAGLGNGTSIREAVDVAVYLGDVQGMFLISLIRLPLFDTLSPLDHILSLQHSLTHYERMLSELHPTYTSQLTMNVAKIRSGSDSALLILTTLSMGVIILQVLIGELNTARTLDLFLPVDAGVFSLNVNLPANALNPMGRYNMFSIIIALCIVITCGFLYVVRLWWIQAKRKRDPKSRL